MIQAKYVRDRFFALSTKGRKISVREGLCGGAGRTRTSNQAVMSRHRGLGGLELPTKRLSAASSEHAIGAIRNEPGNLCLRETVWWGWEDSNS